MKQTIRFFVEKFIIRVIIQKGFQMKPLLLASKVFFLILAVSVCSCEDNDLDDINPESDLCFETTEGDLYAEMTINFNASCSAPSSYYVWDFGDGSNATGMEVSHTYDVEGQYEVILSAGNHPDSLEIIDKTLEVLPSPFIKHCDDIDGDEVWEEGMHLIRCNIDINGSLTISPGAEVYFEEKKLLEINGKLIAQGTYDKPIKFLPANNSTTPGSWGYIYFTSTASAESVMDYCEVKYGGNAGYNSYPNWEYYTDFGVIHLEECEISIENTIIEGAANFGISLSENAKFLSFENNTFLNNTSNPIRFYGAAVESIGNTSTFVGEKDIIIAGDEYFSPEQDITWYAQDVPYYIDGSINLSTKVNLTIEAGTVVELENNGSMNVGYFRATSGSLTAIGTEAEPVVFTSAKDEKNRGDWSGLMISDNSVLEHCIIEYAGAKYTVSGYQRALQVQGSGAVVNQCTIQECSRYGIDMDATSATITNNTIKNCSDYGAVVNIKQYQIIDQSNVFESTGGFYISGGSGFNADATLEKRDYPYVIAGLSFYANATLTIEPGTEIQLGSGGSFTMGYNHVSNSYSGNLIANGTPEEPITFSLYYKDKEEGNGNWGALVFGEESSTSVISNCILTDGGNVIDGNGRTYPEMGMIHCYKTMDFPTITNCTISNSATYGITLDQSTIISSSNVFSNNANGDVISF
ncbi:MAG: right-handed parallel beta-helix repeat-containing protein [Bacteroidota bacterium]